MKYEGSEEVNININGTVENYGIIGGVQDSIQDMMNIVFSGDVLNNGSIGYLKSIAFGFAFDSILGSISNVDAYVWWFPFDGYSDYIIDITGEGENSVSQVPGDFFVRYLLPSYILGRSDVHWRVKGDGIISDSPWLIDRCINVPGCFGGDG